MKHSWRVAMIAVLLGGCSLAPDYQRPAIDMPETWSIDSERQDNAATAAAWWSGFGNDTLDELMATALERNTDLRASLARVEQARAGLTIAGASLLPSADLSAGASRTRSLPARGSASTETSWRGGTGISYELDLFGANRAGRDAADAQLAASRFDHQALSLVVAGDVARGYFTLLNLRERLAIATENRKNAAQILSIIQARFDAGAVGGLELSQQKSALANQDASLASLNNQVIAAENALSVLLGEAPQTRAFPGASLRDIPVPAIAAGQPSELLERRPDIRSAEAGLVAANADIGAARAALFPSITIGLDAAVSGDPLSRSLGIASSLLAPIFQGGRLQAGVDRATARQVELAENYRKAILVALREVEDTLATAQAAEQRRAAFDTAYRQAERAHALSRQLYDAGSVDFQTLLNTQNSLLSAQDNHASARLDVLNAAIDLYLALGGGWR